jgi:hypothetical protein
MECNSSALDKVGEGWDSLRELTQGILCIILSTKHAHQLSQPRPVSPAIVESCIGAYPPVTSLECSLFCLVLLLFIYLYSQFPQLSFACFVYLQANSFTSFCCCLPIRSCVWVRFNPFTWSVPDVFVLFVWQIYLLNS